MCDLESLGTPSTLRVIHNTVVLVRMLSTFDLRCEENTVHLKWNWSQVELLKVKKSGPDDSSNLRFIIINQ